MILFAREGLAQIPKLLTLQDRNPHSPTYGCFDRNFWHYKIIDFPSGMAQEFVWPVALACALEIPGNPFHGRASLRDWVEAGIRFAARSAHPDGSCDDYFPFERAAGAAAFSLLACVESAALLELESEEFDRFFQRRADWLARHHETGRLTNHQALIVLCLELLSARMNTSRWEPARAERLERVLAWQSAEGWFQEYEGFDPGYHTLTISCLARIHELRPDPRLREALLRAVEVAAQWVHPDGSYGGEYGSRNTYNFFPHGFELVGRWAPEALAVNDRFLQGLAAGRGPCYADDHILGHHAWNYLLAWRDRVDRGAWSVERLAVERGAESGERPESEGPTPNAQRPSPTPTHPYTHTPIQQERVWLKEAGLLIDRRQGTELYVALNKGGVFKLFRDGRLVASDTHVSLQVRQGARLRNAVGHLVDDYEVEVESDTISVRGSLGWAKQKGMDPLSLVLLRAFMLTVGRFFPNLVRGLLQKLLVTGKKTAPYRFRRRLAWEEGRWRVTDAIEAPSWEPVTSAGIGPAQTSIYVVMSRTFQEGQLEPWLDLTEKVRKLGPGETLQVERLL